MKNTPQTAEQNNRRRDIGSGQYYELLNGDLLDLIFNNVEIKERMLYRNSTAFQIIWDKSSGLAVTNSSERLSVLVISQRGAAQIKDFTDRHGGFSTLTKELMTSKVRESVISAITEQLAAHVKIGRVKDYTSLDLARFKLDHMPTEVNRTLEEDESPETYPRRRLVSEHTTDTGKTTAIMLKSVMQPVTVKQSSMPASHPGTNPRGTVQRKVEAAGNRFFPRARTVLAAFDTPDTGPRQADIVPDVTQDSSVANVSTYLIHTGPGGDFKVLQPGPDKKQEFLKAGGPSQNLVVHSAYNAWDTRKNSYKDEGTTDSPTCIQPSAYFYPAPTVLSDIKTAWQTLVDNPAIIMGLLLLAINSSDKKTHYTTVYKNLPLVITDLENNDGEL